ncbi:MAG: glycosyltransferase family 39 protein [Candidatus Binatia bacterium]|nr:glycosyltransferase family 39 protein [Candidatus Binatia bacterium]
MSDERAYVVPKHPLATVLLGVFSAGLYLSFVRYGVNLDDEGTILYQILRTYRGQLPYIDFHTGYTPAMFYLNAGLMEVFGVSVMPLRLFLVGVNTAAVLLIFRLALRVAPPAESAFAALTYALFLPFFAGQFASFNIPYPAWYGVTAWLLTQLASVKAVETNKRAWLATAGALAGLAFSFKPNTGVLALGAVVLTRLITMAPLAGRLGAWLEGTVLAIAFGGVFAVLTFEVFTEQFLFLGVPILLLVAGSGYLRRRAHAAAGSHLRPVADGFKDVGVLLLGFTLVVGAWLAYFLPLLGLERFGREVLLLGAGVERIYLLYYPDVSGWTLAVLAALVSAWVLPRAIAQGWIQKRVLLGGSAVVVAAAVLALAVFGLAPEGFIISIAMQLENVSYFVIPLLLAGSVAMVLLRLGEPAAFSGGREDALPVRLGVVIALVVFGVFLFLQLYPRIDFMHVVISMPSALILGAGALYRLERWWWRELGDPEVPDIPHGRVWAAIRVAALVPLAVGLGARALPFADARLSLEGDLGPRRMTRLHFDSMPIEIERDRDHDIRELSAAARFVEASTKPGEPIVTFPALGIVPFLTDRSTPVPHDYFFAGRPSHADEAEMVEHIAEVAPSLVVTLNDRLGYFSAAPAYYFILRDFVLQNYVLVRRFGRFDVLARRDLAEDDPAWATLRQTGVVDGPSMAFARGRFREEARSARRLSIQGRAEDLEGLGGRLADVDRGVRGVWAQAFQSIADREPRGLPAVEAVVAPDRRSRLLFVRALGEYADTRALPYLQEVFLENDGRIRWEAARSINYVLARKLADRFRLYDPPVGPLWDLPAELPSEEMVALIDDFVERQRIGPLAAIAAAHAGRRDLAPDLEHFESERETTWWRMIAALSLVELGQPEHLRTMLDALNTGTLAAQYVPSLMLDSDLVERDELAAALLETLSVGTVEERETVAWMIPYLGAPEAREALALAREDSDPAVRRAATWAAEKMGRHPLAQSRVVGPGGTS